MSNSTAKDKAIYVGINVKEYDTELEYLGAIDYKTDSGDQYWAYFDQVEKVV